MKWPLMILVVACNSSGTKAKPFADLQAEHAPKLKAQLGKLVKAAAGATAPWDGLSKPTEPLKFPGNAIAAQLEDLGTVDSDGFTSVQFGSDGGNPVRFVRRFLAMTPQEQNGQKPWYGGEPDLVAYENATYLLVIITDEAKKPDLGPSGDRFTPGYVKSHASLVEIATGKVLGTFFAKPVANGEKLAMSTHGDRTNEANQKLIEDDLRRSWQIELSLGVSRTWPGAVVNNFN